MDFDEDLLDDGREEERRGSGRKKNKERKKDEEPSRFDDEDFIREQMKDPRIILYEELFKEKISDEDIDVDLNMILGPYLIKHPEGLLPDEVAEIRAKAKEISDLINKTKAKYPLGTMISFISSKRKRKIHRGDMGTVVDVDDAGRIHVEWDDGTTTPLNDRDDKLKIVYIPEKDKGEEEEEEELTPLT